MMRQCHLDGFLNLAFGAAIWSLDSLDRFLKKTFTGNKDPYGRIIVWFFLPPSIVFDSVGCI